MPFRTDVFRFPLQIARSARAPKTRRSKQQRAERRQSALDAIDSASLGGEEVLHLPRHLRHYGRQLRHHGEYSGPALLSAESEEGYVEYKLRLSSSNPTRFQQLVSAS